MRPLFAFLSLIACGALGMLSSRSVSRRMEAAAQWNAALGRMEAAAARGNSLMDILLAGADGEENGLAKSAAYLREHPAASREEWLSVFPWDSLLRPKETAILRTGLSALFSPSRDEQAQGLLEARNQWRKVLADCEKDGQSRCRLYRQLGWLGGAALFILMI